MEKLYSTPLGGSPQPLPPYWRFADGTIRTDLPDLNDAELEQLGWVGPIQPPIRKRVVFKKDLTEQQIKQYENTSKYVYNVENESWTLPEDAIFKKDLTEEEIVQIQKYQNTGRYVYNAENESWTFGEKVFFKKDLTEEEIGPNYEYNAENESWSTKIWDYDQETTKAVWSVKKRDYVFLGLDEDETLVNNPPPVLWDKFKMSLFKSEKFNKYVLDLSIAYPVISTSLSIEIKNLNQGFNQEFINIWEYAKESFPLPEDVILELTEIANSCNLTEEDLNFLIKEDKENVN